MKSKVLKIIGLILVYVAISIAIYFVLQLCGLNSVNKIRDFISSTGGWGYLIFFLFQIVVSTFVCIIPMEDELLTVSAIVLFGVGKGFLVASFNMFVTSMIQFLIGRYCCKSLVQKILGEESIEKYQKYLQVKGEIMLPILYNIPLFPHDTLCFLSGISKMKWWYFALVTLLMRSIEIACVCFLGGGFIDYKALTVVDWIIIVNLLIIDIYLILKLQKFIETKIDKRNSK